MQERIESFGGGLAVLGGISKQESKAIYKSTYFTEGSEEPNPSTTLSFILTFPVAVGYWEGAGDFVNNPDSDMQELTLAECFLYMHSAKHLIVIIPSSLHIDLMRSVYPHFPLNSGGN